MIRNEVIFLANTKAPTSGNSGKKPAKTPAKKPTKKPVQGKAAKKKKPAAAAVKDPVRGRELKLFLCFALALFALIGCFTGEGIFIAFFKRIVLGVVGRGFYVAPLILIACGLQYALVRDKPLTGRILCTLLLSVMAGAFCQLFGYHGIPLGNEHVVRLLYENGSYGGGVLGGLLAQLFRSLFNRVGAAILLVLLTAFLLLTAAGENIASVLWHIQERKRRKAEEWELYRQQQEEQEVQREKPVMNPPKPQTPPKRKRIDFPLDDAPASPTLQGEFFDRMPEPEQPRTKPKPTEAEQPQKPAAEEKPKKPAKDNDWLSAVITKDLLKTEGTSSSALPTEEAPSADLAPQIHESIGAEAAAALAGEKAVKAAERAEMIQAKAEMVADIEESVVAEAQTQKPEYRYPSVTLLNSGVPEVMGKNNEELAETAKLLSATIQSFGIPARICDLTRGPTVTRYEVELDKGVKLNRLTGLADDIALALGVSGVRIAPIPDKSSIVGIEVPNKTTATVYLRDIIDRAEFRERSSALAFAVGKDIGGTPVVGDIDKLTHLLIAGTTGSGKSVCMNSLILSLLYKSGPEQVRLIMIDPKMIELGIYNGIPHLLIPVVTDPKKAAGALQWAVMEMLRRYRLIADSGTRDLNSYNAYAEKHREEGVQTMPRLVILIDELADLMLVAAKDVEESICRIAQMGRAAGIHIVIATQRPSADVITGLMKANIPSRIAFAVDSSLNSRIILDTAGAEKLLGKGDMLYAPIGAGKPLRVQGTFVTDREREDVVDFVKAQGLEDYSKEVQDEIERRADKKENKPKGIEDGPEDDGDSELDDLYEEAVNVVVESKQASTSMLQRRLKLGYTRAARIIDQMEERGVIGPFEGSKPRAVLLTKQQWDELRGRAEPTDEADEAAAAEEREASNADLHDYADS